MSASAIELETGRRTEFAGFRDRAGGHERVIDRVHYQRGMVDVRQKLAGAAFTIIFFGAGKSVQRCSYVVIKRPERVELVEVGEIDRRLSITEFDFNLLSQTGNQAALINAGKSLVQAIRAGAQIKWD